MKSSWGLLEAILGLLKPSWSLLGALLGPSWGLLATSWSLLAKACGLLATSWGILAPQGAPKIRSMKANTFTDIMFCSCFGQARRQEQASTAEGSPKYTMQTIHEARQGRLIRRKTQCNLTITTKKTYSVKRGNIRVEQQNKNETQSIKTTDADNQAR